MPTTYGDTTNPYFPHSREERALRGPKNEEEEAVMEVPSGAVSHSGAASSVPSWRRRRRISAALVESKLSGEKIENIETKRNECTYVYVWKAVGGLGTKEVELTKGETSISPRKSSPPFQHPTYLSRGSPQPQEERQEDKEADKEADKKRTKKRTRSRQRRRQ